MAQVVVITGGSAGIGRAAAKAFATKGYDVGLIARGPERLAEAKAELEATGVRVHTVVADVADADAIDVAADEIEAALGPVNVWVNNAMATVYSPIKHLDASEVRRVTEVTYMGAVHGTLTALKRMKAGTIVQVSSVLSWRAIPVQGPYCGAKFALRGFTEALRSELIHDRSNVHLTMVHLPAINTPQFDWARNKTGQRAQAPGPYQPEVAADAIYYAATHRRRDVFVGSSTPPSIFAARLAPGLVDRALATKGYEQLGDEAAPANGGNLFEPAPGGQQAAHGRFDAEASSRRDIYTSRQADGVAVGLLVAGAAGLAMLVASPLFIGPAMAARAVGRMYRR
jgi:short-subunit dehydrogenase